MVLPITNVQLFQFLKEKVREKEAEALVTFVESKIQEGIKETNEQNLKILATKEDLAKTNQKIDIVRTEIAASKAEMIKWMFIFWMGAVGVLSGIIITLLNVYMKH